MRDLQFFFILFALAILNSCNSDANINEIELNGNIGKFNAKILLHQTGDKFAGSFIYSDLNKPEITVSGTLEGAKMILHEFNEDNILKGIFEGKYSNGKYNGSWRSPNGGKKVKFSFSTKKEEITATDIDLAIKKTAKSLKALNPRELIKIHFNPFKIKNSKIGYYKEKDTIYEVEYEKVEKYQEGGEHLALVFFGNFKCENNFDREYYHVASGFLSIAKYKKNNGLWEFVEFVKKTGIGHSFWGSVSVPRIEKHGKFHFLIASKGSTFTGTEYEFLHIYNASNLQYAASFQVVEINDGAVEPGTEGSISFFRSVTFQEKGKQLYLLVESEGTKYDHTSDKEFYTDEKVIYLYDEKELKFIKSDSK